MAAEVSVPDSEPTEKSAKTSASQHTGAHRSVTAGRVLVAIMLALAVFALYCYYSVQQLKHWITPSWDLAIFTQMAQAYSHFGIPIVQIKGTDFNLWGDHFHPILVLLGPVYAVFPSPLTLLVVQNFMVAASVYMMVRFTQRACAFSSSTKPEPVGTFVGVLLGAAFALSYGVQQAVAAQFHEVAFALPFLCGALGNLVLAGRINADERSRYIIRACLWAAPLAFVKEDMGVTAAMIGIVAFVRTGWIRKGLDELFPQNPEGKPLPRGERIRNTFNSWVKTRGAAESTMLILWGLFWSYAAVALILPLFNANGQFDYGDKVDVYGAFADPLGSAITIFNYDQKVWTILLLLFCGAIIWVASPFAIVILPTLLWRLLSNTEAYWLSTWHYSLVLMPVAFLALLEVILNLRYGKVLAHPKPLAEDEESEDEPAETGDKPIGWVENLRQSVRRVPLWFFPAVALLVSVIPTVTPTSDQPLADLTKSSFTSNRLTASETSRMQAVEAVPQDVSVAADLSTLTQLIPGRTVYWIGHAGEPAPDYVVIDKRGSAWGGNPPQNTAQYAADRYGHPYAQVGTYGSLEVVRKIS